MQSTPMQLNSHLQRLRTALLVIVAGLAATGCLLTVQSDSRWRHGSAAMDSADRIQSGTTTRDWVLDHLGNPDSSYVNSRGNEVMRYVSRRETDAQVHLFLLFSIDVSDEELHTIHVEIEDEIVRGWWVEQ